MLLWESTLSPQGWENIVQQMHNRKALTSSLSSAHIMTGVHPRTKHLQTYSTLNQTRNLQIHSWLALIFFFFFRSTTEKSCLRNQTADMALVHIWAPWLIRITVSATNRASDLAPRRVALWVLHKTGNKTWHVLCCVLRITALTGKPKLLL